MDINYLLFLQRIREITGGVFDTFFLKATLCGESIITFLLLAGIYWCVSKRTGQYMFFNIAFASSLNQSLKKVFHIERPWIRDARVVPVQEAVPGAGGYSMPSGHTTRAVAVWGAAGTSILHHNSYHKDKNRRRRILSVLLWGVACVVMFSRNYLGVHTPQDVVVALLLGMLLLYVTEKVLQWVDAVDADDGDEKEKKNPSKSNRDLIVLAVGSLLLLLPMLRYGCLSNTGAGFGFLLGWVLERRFVKFEVEAGKLEKAIRFIIGGAVIVIIVTSMSPMLVLWMPSRYAGFFTMFAVAMFISVIYPFLFSAGGSYGKYRRAIVTVMILAGICLCAATIYKVRLQQDAVPPQDTVAEETSEVQPEVQEDSVDVSQYITGNVKIIAHRGYSSVYPENTLAAFAGAVDIGADMIELDVQETKDGVIVVFHDDNLSRVTGQEGAIADYTYDELSAMDAGSWFSEDFAGERIPTLAEVMDLMKDTDMDIYLELKDIGEVDGFEESVLQVVDEYDMRERCLFASFQYSYLQTYENIDASINTLLNTTSEAVDLAETFPADYYGLYDSVITSEQVADIYNAGKHAYVWTVSEPSDMKRVMDMGVEGIVTNYPGRAKVAIRDEYSILSDCYVNSFAMPGLYDGSAGAAAKADITIEDKIVQGLTRIGDELVISAYSSSGEENSILYRMNTEGNLREIVNLGFKAHTGGVSYDVQHDLLWITGPEGHVYALSWEQIVNSTDNQAGDIQVDFDAGLLNHNESKVASFLTVYNEHLYVGSYVDGANGMLKEYDITNPEEPLYVGECQIPERIQGITFAKVNGKTQMLLSQGYQTEDASLLVFDYTKGTESYTEPRLQFTLPEGAEQIQAVDNSNLYILFESAVRPYRATARVVNDQIYLLSLGNILK